MVVVHEIRTPRVDKQYAWTSVTNLLNSLKKGSNIKFTRQNFQILNSQVKIFKY